MFKKLHIRIEDVRYSIVAFKITEQSHRRDEFGDDVGDSSSFTPSIGHELYMSSDTVPEWETELSPKILFVRGEDKDGDDNILLVDKSDFSLITQMILEYNQQYNNNSIDLSDVVEGLELLEKKNV